MQSLCVFSWRRSLSRRRLAAAKEVPETTMSISEFIVEHGGMPCEQELDRLASLKGWEKLSTSQPAMASYRKDGNRLNFYLSTGTVGSCLDHPRQGKTQLFRRKVTDPSSLFDNPRQHTGEGYHTKAGAKKRKAESGLGRVCAACKQTKPFGEFSKNQRRK